MDSRRLICKIRSKMANIKYQITLIIGHSKGCTAVSDHSE